MTTGEPYYESQGSTDLPLYGQDDTAQGSSATQQVADKAKQGADQVKQTASNVTDQAKQKAMSQAATQKDQAAESLNTVSDAVNQAAQQLRQNNQTPIAQVAESAASGINQLADHLRSRNITDLIGEVEDFASNQPALFLGGAFLVGVLGARFLKSSRAGMTQSSPRQWRGAPTGYTTRTGYGARYYGDQYYGATNEPSPPGRSANVNTGGLAYGRNLPTNGGPDAQATARRVNGTYETYPSDEDIIAGEAPR
ncbi:MAG TPA: hypothetical protein VFN78_04890 [Ktedonobacterales bacterium]|nr:hypothetical protein [Ktedonobacterales bacterium]